MIPKTSRALTRWWFRSPFKTKSQDLKAYEDFTLMQCAASFVAHTKLDINLTCHVNGKIVDPSTALVDVSTSEVISFKFAPLQGGAKKGAHDVVKTRVAKILETHGIPGDACSERAAAFMQKADVETIAKM